MNKTISTLEHLKNVSSIYKNDISESNKLVECHLMSEYVERLENPLNTKDKSTFLKRCRWCLITWRVGMNSIYIEPEKRRGKSMRYICNKKSEHLNKYQRKFVNKCKKNDNCNYLVVLCHVCRKRSKLPLKKPIQDNNVNTVEDLSLVNVKKKKKKKKDSCAGLNPNIVAQVHATTSNNNSTKKITNQNAKLITKPLENSVANKNVHKGKTKFDHKSKLKIKAILQQDPGLAASSNDKKKPKPSLISFLDSCF